MAVVIPFPYPRTFLYYCPIMEDVLPPANIHNHEK